MDYQTQYCPGALSFIFEKATNSNILKTGSIGVGCTINKGVTVKIAESKKMEIFFNGEKISFPTVNDTIRAVTEKKFSIFLTSDLPLGCGFGLSAASSLASAFLIKKMFNLSIPHENIIKFTHAAEIRNGTGLGTVGTISKGGFILKKTAGIPFSYLQYPFTGKTIYATIVDKLKTKDIIQNKEKIDRMRKKGARAIYKIMNRKDITFENVFDTAYNTCLEGGLITNKDVLSMINMLKAKGGHCTMAILGHVVLSTTKIKSTRFKTIKLSVSEDSIYKHIS